MSNATTLKSVKFSIFSYNNDNFRSLINRVSLRKQEFFRLFINISKHKKGRESGLSMKLIKVIIILV